MKSIKTTSITVAVSILLSLLMIAAVAACSAVREEPTPAPDDQQAQATTAEPTAEPTQEPEETPDPRIPDEEWFVDRCWRYAELANKTFDYCFTRDQREVDKAGSISDWYIVRFKTDENDELMCVFDYSSDDGEWQLNERTIYTDLSEEEIEELSGRYKPWNECAEEVPLTGLEINVTADELEAAGCHLSGGELTEEDLAAISRYRAELLAAQYVGCPEDNMFRCYEADVAELGPVTKRGNEYLLQSFLLIVRPVEPRCFSQRYADVGCNILGDEWGEEAGWFSIYFQVIITVEADGSFTLTTGCNTGD